MHLKMKLDDLTGLDVPQFKEYDMYSSKKNMLTEKIKMRIN